MQGVVLYKGRDIASEQEYVVVFRQIPSSDGKGIAEKDHCLVVNVNNLTHPYNIELGNVIEEQSVKEQRDLFKVLAKRRFQSGEVMLDKLHESRKLQKVRTSDILMQLTSQDTMLLSQVNEKIEQYDAVHKANQAPIGGQNAPGAPQQAVPTGQGADSAAELVQGLKHSPEEEARMLMQEADYLRAQADAAEAKAQALLPTPVADVKPAQKAPAKKPGRKPGRKKAPAKKAAAK